MKTILALILLAGLASAEYCDVFKDPAYHTIIYNIATGEIGDSFYSNRAFQQYTHPDVSPLHYYSQVGAWGNKAKQITLDQSCNKTEGEPNIFSKSVMMCLDYCNVTDDDIIAPYVKDYKERERIAEEARILLAGADGLDISARLYHCTEMSEDNETCMTELHRYLYEYRTWEFDKKYNLSSRPFRTFNLAFYGRCDLKEIESCNTTLQFNVTNKTDSSLEHLTLSDFDYFTITDIHRFKAEIIYLKDGVYEIYTKKNRQSMVTVKAIYIKPTRQRSGGGGGAYGGGGWFVPSTDDSMIPGDMEQRFETITAGLSFIDVATILMKVVLGILILALILSWVWKCKQENKMEDVIAPLILLVILLICFYIIYYLFPLELNSPQEIVAETELNFLIFCLPGEGCGGAITATNMTDAKEECDEFIADEPHGSCNWGNEQW